MRKGLKVPNKKVIIPEDGEEEKVKKAEAKKAMIRAEFEKHKKEIMINVSGASKINEIKLKNQLEELFTANSKKKDELQRLENSEQTLGKQNLENTQFYETIHRFDHSKDSDAYLSVGFHPNRTTSTMFSMRDNNMAEMLSDKTNELAETLANIELLLEQEDEMGSNVFDRFSELQKNQILLNKKVNELKRMNDHCEKRFSDLKRVEFLARNKHAATASNLKEMKDSVKELKNHESEYKTQKEEEKVREKEYLNNKQNEMSNVLIEIDRKRVELQNSQDELKRLELLHEEMRDKRKNTRIVTKYIETFDALEGKRNSMSVAQQALRDFAENSDISSESSPHRRSPSSNKHGKKNSSFTGLHQRLSKVEEEHKAFPVKRDSVMERNYYIEKIQTFYERHPEGPQGFVDRLIEQYLEQCYKEKSFKINYEDLQNHRRNQEHELQELQEALGELKGKNHYITLGRTGSKILDRNEQEAIDSGMVVINHAHTTINQAKFEFENKKDTDNEAILFTKTEAFVLRCYLYSVEMMTRISKVLYAMSNQSGGYLPEDIRDMSKTIYAQLVTIKKVIKKNKPELSASQTPSEHVHELHRSHTENTSSSEKERDQDQIATLDLQDVYNAFLSMFEGKNAKASDFVSHIKNDVMMTSFLTLDDIRTYMQSHQNELFMDSQIEKILQDIDDLRKVATDNMMSKFNTLYKTYGDFISLAQQAIEEASGYLKEKGIKVELGDVGNRTTEETGFIKKAVERKWQTLQDRYDYDPRRDYRRITFVTDTPAAHQVAKPKAEAENDDDDKERLERDDLRVRLNEIASAELRKIKGELSMGSSNVQFKSRAEEEKRKAVQAKKDKERQKQAVENMNDDEFLDYQRKQLRENKKELVTDLSESQLFRKAQADLAQRLSKTVLLDELKKIIENSKFLNKIQILEKQKFVTDGKRNFKQKTENYIPHEPLKVPKSSTLISHPDWKIRITRNAFTPSSRAQTRGGYASGFASTSDRLTESETGDSPKDLSFKVNNTIQASKFKPRFTPTDFTTEATTFDNDKPRTQGSKRISTFESFKKKPSKDEEEERRIRTDGGKISSFFEPSKSIQNENDEPRKKNRLIIDTKHKKQKTAGEPHSTKNKSGGVDLPKLLVKKKKEAGKKKLRNMKKIEDQDNINLLLNLQTDPMLKMVYSPSFFATSFPAMTLPEDLGYQFDSFKYKVPSLLISEKI